MIDTDIIKLLTMAKTQGYDANTITDFLNQYNVKVTARGTSLGDYSLTFPTDKHELVFKLKYSDYL